ncbi:MAG TPA: hypothetical protein VGB85_33805 [Nannocystis sp.]|jgi:hypothetical protein
MRKINLMNEAARNAQVVIESVRKQDGPTQGLPGKKLAFKRYVATTENGLHSKLAQNHGDALAKALIEGDPEIDKEVVGRDVGDTQTVFLSGTGEVLHASPSLVEVIFGADGKERERKPAESVPANTNEESPVRWTKMRLKRSEVVTKFAFCRTIQIKHVDGLSFDFLHAMAKELADKDEVARLGAGPKGRDPLIFQENGARYQAFLEGRVDGPRYKLLLHLSNLELRTIAGAAS